jgi:transglutaminase-like putative cysteine protease
MLLEQGEGVRACRVTVNDDTVETILKIRAGYDIAFKCLQDVPMVLMLTVHPSRRTDLVTGHAIRVSPNVGVKDYTDVFGNVCTRLVAPAGLIEIRNEFVIEDNGLPDAVVPHAAKVPLDKVPDDALVYLLGSRYCDTQKLTDLAWSKFGHINAGWQLVQSICDYVHDRIQFGYHFARGDRTASEGHQERVGVCRDFAHLAIALCRS